MKKEILNVFVERMLYRGMGKEKRNTVQFEYPRGNFPRLCLIGNSNVGKSSLTRLLLSHPKWYKGKVGKTAGSTFRLTIINDPNLPYHVIDLPGFGHMSNIRRDERNLVMDQILNYLELDSRNVFLTLMVIAADRLDDELEKWYFKNQDTIPLSVEFIQFITDLGIPCGIVLNKIDKLNQYQTKNLIKKFIGVLADFDLDIQGSDAKDGILKIIQTSVKKSEDPGVKQVRRLIHERAQRIDKSKFDPRKELLKKPPINIQKYDLNKENAQNEESIKKNMNT